MIPRYSREKMTAIWSQENKYAKWLDVEVAACEAMVKLGAAEESLAGKKAEQLAHRAETMRYTLKISLVVGILISAAGIRTLEHMIQATSPVVTQGKLFTVMDIAITSGLIAGGSDGIHKLTTVLTNYLESMATLAKKAADPK